MITYVVVCKTIEPEYMKAVSTSGTDLPVLWLEAGLHNQPNLLREAVQAAIDEAAAAGAERVLLCMGVCGNSMLGIESHGVELILPRVDDCISLMLGSFRRRLEVQRDMPTFFMTKGWIRGERSIVREYEYIMDKYGEEDGKEIFDMMMGHYRRIGILDTGAYEMAPVIKETEDSARMLGLEWAVIAAGTDYMEQLLTGPWPDNGFIRIAPGRIIVEKDLKMEAV